MDARNAQRDSAITSSCALAYIIGRHCAGSRSLVLVTPSGDEERLTPGRDGEFVVGDKESAERLRFDTIVDDAALHATLSGVPYYRSFTP